MKKYNEPWRIVELKDVIGTSVKDEVMVMTRVQYELYKLNPSIPNLQDGFIGVFKRHEAIRIVNCVNACAGEPLVSRKDSIILAAVSFACGLGAAAAIFWMI